MVGLQGDLRTMSLAELLRFVVGKGLKGTIRCAQGPNEKSFVVIDGQAVLASSNDAREYLGQFLINFGHVTEQQLDEAFETQRQTTVYLGKILTMIDLVSEPELEAVLQLKIRETVLSLTEWTYGTFFFQQDVVPDLGPGVQVAVTLANIEEEADFRRTAWESIRQVFPRGTDLLRVDRAALAADHNNPLDLRILEYAEQGESIDGIALHLHATPFAFYQRLFSLYRLGVVAPVEAPELDEVEVEVVDLDAIPDVMGAAADLGSLLAQVKTFLEAGRFDEAETVARRATALEPTDATAQTALREAELLLLTRLRDELLVQPRCPRLVRDPRQLDPQSLGPAERYLMKRFDGTRTLSQVIRVSPIRELDALKLVKRFLATGVVVLEEPA
ncbi:MAG: DUF4388 domain-containing protein [Deltaproteobacteria bacterium]|nr:DUF4388 domain-containing protein [Deltaproteobacteria bacterium]